MKRRASSVLVVQMWMLSVCILATPSTVFANPIGKASGGGTSIEWQLAVTDHESVLLTVSAPNGEVISKEFRAGSNVSLSLKDLKTIEDGRYDYQLSIIPRIPQEVKRQLEAARLVEDEVAARSIRKAAGIERPMVQSGAFTVQHGGILSPDQPERGRPALRAVADDELIADDLIVDGRACVGNDCLDGEAFGAEQLLLKSMNVRVRFMDTSDPESAFPSNDWQLRVNEAGSGGIDKFSIEDLPEGTTPFTIEGGALTNMIYADRFGKIGFGTSMPSEALHIDTATFRPGIALEQNGSAGLEPAVWRIAGDADFFRVGFGGTIISPASSPFRIHPQAPNSSLVIHDGGNVGLGTSSPTRALQVIDSAAADNTVLEIENDGPTRMRIRNSSTGETWNIGHQSPSGTGLVYSDVGDSTSEMLLDISGNVTIAGTLTQGSSREIKKDFDSLDPAVALEGVRRLPILTWRYKEGEVARHVGPMAEEFHAAFGFGIDDKHIAPSDQAGVALAAIQALAAKNDQLEARIKQLEELLQRRGLDTK